MSTERPALTAVSMARRRSADDAPGIATMTLRTDNFSAQRGDSSTSPRMHAVQFVADARRVGGEHADDAPVGRLREFAQQAFGGVAGAEHQHRFAPDHQPAVERAVLPRAVGKAAAAHGQHQQDRVQDQHRARDQGTESM